MAQKLEAIVETYFSALRDVHGIGAGTKERSYYPALAALFDAIGAELRPKVLCLSDLGDTGAGFPDFGLFASNQVQRGEPRRGQVPERGVIEVKSTDDDAWLIADTAQVTKYFGAYRLVVVTNFRDFLIIGEGTDGRAVRLEAFQLAPDAKSFWRMVSNPRKAAQQIGTLFGEYLERALTQTVALTEPRHLAWFIASYARDALLRVEAASNLQALSSVRTSLEQALGVSFGGDKGDHFFRSTLVQTLFYGVFSAWEMWAREVPRTSAVFDWKSAVWHLNVPFVRALYQQLASPAHLQPLQLVELLDWTASTLNRVKATDFFARFNDADAVQFFYEPFLEAFDPELRKELGVWYTPSEVVAYMVARVDKALKDDLGVADGLASEQVYILDPCCGTGAYLAAVLRRIDESLIERGYGALRGQIVKKAALERIIGFEIMPAPFVVAHLKVGIVLRSLGATLDEDHERASIYLTNALTGWEPVASKPLPFPDLEAERRRADGVKQEAPILVILGNPPYNGYAGMAIDEERDLSNAYRTTKRVRRPEGQGLNDLYVRFFRMAERRIADKTGRGIVSFISNYSWLDGLSFTGMRERYLDAFDIIRIDRLNGDKYRTGKTTPDGLPDPSVFSTEHNREGIQVGTAIATLVRKAVHAPTTEIAFRNLWGVEKRADLLATANKEVNSIYTSWTPSIELSLSFVPRTVSTRYFSWPTLKEIFPFTFSGVQTRRDAFLVSTDLAELEQRKDTFFDQELSTELLLQQYPSLAVKTAQYDPYATRRTLLSAGPQSLAARRFFYRPFDTRFALWTADGDLLGRPSEEYIDALPSDCLQIVAPRAQRKEYSVPLATRAAGDLNSMDGGASYIPQLIHEHRHADGTRPMVMNLQPALASLLATNSCSLFDVMPHALAVTHAPNYARENAEGMRAEWPRIPITTSAANLRSSADLGLMLAGLLDPDIAIAGVSQGALRRGLRTLGLPRKRGGQPLLDTDLHVSAGWGRVQPNAKGSVLVMPGNGSVVTREYTPAEQTALKLEGEDAGVNVHAVQDLLGSRTVDIHLNENAWWENVPLSVWDYSLGGYQVIKKWLSYREQSVLGRPLTVDEVAYVSEMVRRIAAILLMGPSLDANYETAKANAIEWSEGRPAVEAAPTLFD